VYFERERLLLRDHSVHHRFGSSIVRHRSYSLILCAKKEPIITIYN
jgi:hypothetical protein